MYESHPGTPAAEEGNESTETFATVRRRSSAYCSS